MKTNKYIKLSIFLFAGILIFSACNKKYSSEYDRYDPTPVSESNVHLDYASPLQTYPTKNTIVSDTPSYSIESLYSFGIDTAYSTTGGNFKANNFSIDEECGVIYYDNSGNTIDVGKYLVDVAVINLTGNTVVKAAYELEILDIPIDVTASPDEVTLTTADLGIISQITHTITGDSEPPITDVGYNVEPYGEGFTVNNDGEVSMVEGVVVGEHKLSIVAKTNLGDKLIKNVLTVTVEEANK